VGWRWIFLVNVPIAVGVALAAPVVLRDVREQVARRLDVAGAVTITMALVALIYGLTVGDQEGFDAAVPVAALSAAVLLAVAFVAAERRAADPLVPIRLLRLPTLLGTDVTSFAASTLVASTPFFLTLYMQRILHLSPVATGLAFLPMALTIMVTSTLVARLTERIGVKRLLLFGLIALAAASLLLSRVSAHGAYATDVLPGMLAFAVGLAATYTTTTIGGTAGVRDDDQGIAGGLLNTFNQVGGALGLAVLAALATAGGTVVQPADEALVAGLHAAFLAALGFVAVGVLSAVGLVRASDCERELARRRRQGSGGLDATTAGCLAGLGEQVIDGERIAAGR
jgi:MFS family permease